MGFLLLDIQTHNSQSVVIIPIEYISQQSIYLPEKLRPATQSMSISIIEMQLFGQEQLEFSFTLNIRMKTNPNSAYNKPRI